MKSSISTFLLSFIGLIIGNHSWAGPNYSSMEQLSQSINQVFAANQNRYANEIWKDRPNMEGVSCEALFVTRNCGPAARMFKDDVKPQVNKVRLVETDKHAYLEAEATLQNKTVRLVIDPTYRQFFAVAVSQSFRESRIEPTMELVSEEILRAVPTRVLVIEPKLLRNTLETRFPLAPEWLVQLDFIGAPSKYEDWYRQY